MHLEIVYKTQLLYYAYSQDVYLRQTHISQASKTSDIKRSYLLLKLSDKHHLKTN
jgi:hypothetical protein